MNYCPKCDGELITDKRGFDFIAYCENVECGIAQFGSSELEAIRNVKVAHSKQYTLLEPGYLHETGLWPVPTDNVVMIETEYGVTLPPWN